MAVQLRRTRRLAALALAAAGCAAAVALAGGPTPPKDIRETFPDAEFVLALPAGGGAWTLWSGTMDDRPWLALSSPRAANVGAANCPLPSKP